MTTELHRATLQATFRANDDEGAEEGSFVAIVSAFNVKYRIGWRLHHTIEAGAFDASEGQTIPVFSEHMWGVPIGHGALATVDEGLQLTGTLYLDTDDGRAMWRALKAGAIVEHSIGYRVLAMRADPADDDHEIVTEAEVLESSIVMRGANPNTRTVSVASAGQDIDPAFVDAVVAAFSARNEDPTPIDPPAPPPEDRSHLDMASAWQRTALYGMGRGDNNQEGDHRVSE